MSLTTKDILEKTFKKSFKGYDEDEVDKFLDEIIDEFKAIKAQNEALKKEIKVVRDIESNVRETEDTIMKTLVSAQKSSERILREAARKAELLIDNAQNTAIQKTQQSEKDLVDMERKLAAIKQSAQNFAVSFSDMMNAQETSFEKTYQAYFGDMDAYSSSGINVDALNKIDKSISDDIKGIVGGAEETFDSEDAEIVEPLTIEDNALREEDLAQQLDVEWSLPEEATEEPEAFEAPKESILDEEPEAFEAPKESILDEKPEVFEESILDEEPEAFEAPQEDMVEELNIKGPGANDEPIGEIVKDEPAVPLEPVEEEQEEKNEDVDSIPFNEMNQVLTDIEEEGDDISEATKTKYDDYSWLYGDDEKKDDSLSGLSFKDPKESEELKNLIDDVID